MNTQEFSDLLDSIRNATNLSSFKWFDIQEKMQKLIGCSGCGEGSNCKKDIENRPCTDEVYECDACRNGNPLECTRADPCEDCLWCGCPECRFPIRYYRYYDYDSVDLYIERLEKLEKQVIDAIEDSYIPVETWMSLFSERFIKKYYPYETNRAVWEQNGIEPPTPRHIELEQLDKVYRLVPNSRSVVSCADHY